MDSWPMVTNTVCFKLKAKLRLCDVLGVRDHLGSADCCQNIFFSLQLIPHLIRLFCHSALDFEGKDVK